MTDYGPIYDGVFGDISLSITGSSVDLDLFQDRSEYLENSIRGRLKSLPGDYGEAYKYNLFRLIGTGSTSSVEALAKTTITNMLTFDNLVNRLSLSVSALRQKSQLVVGIRILELGRLKNGKLEMIVTREDDGKLE